MTLKPKHLYLHPLIQSTPQGKFTAFNPTRMISYTIALIYKSYYLSKSDSALTSLVVFIVFNLFNFCSLSATRSSSQQPPPQKHQIQKCLLRQMSYRPLPTPLCRTITPHHSNNNNKAEFQRL